MTFRASKTTVARKEHRCDECMGRIVVGEPYVKSAGVSDGVFYDWRAHPECEEAGQALHLLSDACWGDEYSPMYENLSDAADAQFFRWFALAHPAAWERVRERIEDEDAPLSHFVWNAPMGSFYDSRKPFAWVAL